MCKHRAHHAPHSPLVWLSSGVLSALLMLILSSCERSSPSPIEVKIDNYDVSDISHISGNKKAGSIEFSVENIYGDAGKMENKSVNSASIVSEKPKKDELDEEFSSLMVGGAAASSGSSAAAGTSAATDFNAQAEMLSRPRITKPASVSSSEKEKISYDAEEKKTVAAAKVPLPPFVRPLQGKIISRFGDDMGSGIINDGINIRAASGTKVVSAGNGTVIYAGNKLEEDFGNVVIIQHDNGLITSYAHLKDISVKNNSVVSAGDTIGTVGKTGDVTEPQLHFEVMKNKKPVNPMSYLRK